MLDFLFATPLGQELVLIFYTLVDVISFVIRIGSLVLIPQRHTPSTASAWLLVILLWPWPGIIAYSILGTNILPKRRMQRHAEALKHFQGMREEFKKRPLPGAVAPPLGEKLSSTAKMAERLSYLSTVGGNSVEYLTDDTMFINALVSGIDAAKREVSLLYYIFARDDHGTRVMEACKRAAKRGVTVRVLLDSVGSRDFLKSRQAQEAKQAGVIIAEALPVRIYRAKASRFDLRNHRKLAIFDREVAITGSHNVTTPNYGRKDNLIWKDLSLRLRGAVVRELESVFIEDWYVETGNMLDTTHLFSDPVEVAGKACLQTVPSGPSYYTENYQRIVIASIISAQNQITITTPYLIPDEGMLQAIEVARIRGVRVRLIVPAKSDQIITGYASRAYYSAFLDMGVELYLYDKGLLHAKTVTIDDDLGFVGSSNFDIRSFALNFEINMILYGKTENVGIHKVHDSYIADSHRITTEDWGKRGRISVALESLTKLFSPLL